MLFNSYPFVFLFLPIVFLGYFYLTHNRLIIGSKLWLVFGSLFFYGYWNFMYIPLILLSISTNFFIAIHLIKSRQKMYLIAGILFNILLLGYFKYTDFFIENINMAFERQIPLMNIVLPLGISFFTFTQIAFLVDSYSGKVKEYNWLNYMLFVTYFPHLLAGPILHHSEMMPQFASRWNLAIRWRNVAIGIVIFSIGLFKKVIIADTFAEWANVGFDTTTALNFYEAWITSLSYTLQLYFDFSGYTDMAIGMSLIFNIKLPINFNSPYKAMDIQDFWRRWHITLSRFLRDYVYIPLGGNKVSTFHNYLNLFTVFLIGGIWHGASWMFVIWGMMHGLAMIIHRIWKDFGFKMWKWLGWLITFNFINITWIFFRAKDLDDANKIISGMIKIDSLALFPKNFDLTLTNFSLINIMFVVIGIFIVLIFSNSNRYLIEIKPNKKLMIICSFFLAISILFFTKNTQFIYFNF